MVRKMNVNRWRFWIIPVVLLGLVLSGCTFVRVVNLSEANARVRIKTPDNRQGYTRLVRPGATVDVFSGYGGWYTVTLLPDEQFQQVLRNLETQITGRLFTEGATLSAEEVAMLTQRLNEIDQMQDDLENQVQTSCSGSVPDFETATVFVNYDALNAVFTLQCSVEQSD